MEEPYVRIQLDDVGAHRGNYTMPTGLRARVAIVCCAVFTCSLTVSMPTASTRTRPPPTETMSSMAAMASTPSTTTALPGGGDVLAWLLDPQHTNLDPLVALFTSRAIAAGLTIVAAILGWAVSCPNRIDELESTARKTWSRFPDEAHVDACLTATEKDLIQANPLLYLNARFGYSGPKAFVTFLRILFGHIAPAMYLWYLAWVMPCADAAECTSKCAVLLFWAPYLPATLMVVFWTYFNNYVMFLVLFAYPFSAQLPFRIVVHGNVRDFGDTVWHCGDTVWPFDKMNGDDKQFAAKVLKELFGYSQNNFEGTHFQYCEILWNEAQMSPGVNVIMTVSNILLAGAETMVTNAFLIIKAPPPNGKDIMVPTSKRVPGLLQFSTCLVLGGIIVVEAVALYYPSYSDASRSWRNLFYALVPGCLAFISVSCYGYGFLHEFWFKSQSEKLFAHFEAPRHQAEYESASLGIQGSENLDIDCLATRRLQLGSYSFVSQAMRKGLRLSA